jgi:hypothetical protein
MRAVPWRLSVKVINRRPSNGRGSAPSVSAAWLPIASGSPYPAKTALRPAPAGIARLAFLSLFHYGLAFDTPDIPNPFRRENADAQEYRFALTGRGHHQQPIPNSAHWPDSAKSTNAAFSQWLRTGFLNAILVLIVRQWFQSLLKLIFILRVFLWSQPFPTILMTSAADRYSAPHSPHCTKSKTGYWQCGQCSRRSRNTAPNGQSG